MDATNVISTMRDLGYHFRRKEELAIQVMLSTSSNALLLEGPPGTGKTFLAETLARAIQAEYEYMLCHNWLTDEEIFVGIDVGSAVVGDRDNIYQSGILMRVVEKSKHTPVVVCFDEIDKAPMRVETLLLDFLQYFRVFDRRGVPHYGRKESIIFIATSNNIRPLSEATLRRFYRVHMDFLPEGVEADIVRKKTGVKINVIKTAVRFANIIRAHGETSPSLQEIISLVSALRYAQSAEDVAHILRATLVKKEGDLAALQAVSKTPEAVLWGEMRRTS